MRNFNFHWRGKLWKKMGDTEGTNKQITSDSICSLSGYTKACVKGKVKPRKGRKNGKYN